MRRQGACPDVCPARFFIPISIFPYLACRPMFGQSDSDDTSRSAILAGIPLYLTTILIITYVTVDGHLLAFATHGECVRPWRSARLRYRFHPRAIPVLGASSPIPLANGPTLGFAIEMVFFFKKKKT